MLLLKHNKNYPQLERNRLSSGNFNLFKYSYKKLIIYLRIVFLNTLSHFKLKILKKLLLTKILIIESVLLIILICMLLKRRSFLIKFRTADNESYLNINLNK